MFTYYERMYERNGLPVAAVNTHRQSDCVPFICTWPLIDPQLAPISPHNWPLIDPYLTLLDLNDTHNLPLLAISGRL